MTFLTRRALAILVLGGLTARPLGAQILHEPPAPTECAAWAAQLAAGGPDALQALTYGYLPGCPDLAPGALASAIRAARPSQDVAFLRDLAANAGEVPDKEVLRAALEVAGDKEASDASRVMALLVVVAHMGSSQDVSGLDRSQLFTQPLPGSGVCGFELKGSWGGPASTSYRLPRDAKRLAARTIDAIRYDADEPPLVRNLARCARSVIPWRIPPQVDATKIRMKYVCENVFTIRNGTGAGLPVEMIITAGNGSSERHDMNLPAGGSAIRYVAPVTGTVQMRYDGQLVTTVANTGLRCDKPDAARSVGERSR